MALSITGRWNSSTQYKVEVSGHTSGRRLHVFAADLDTSGNVTGYKCLQSGVVNSTTWSTNVTTTTTYNKYSRIVYCGDSTASTIHIVGTIYSYADMIKGVNNMKSYTIPKYTPPTTYKLTCYYYQTGTTTSIRAAQTYESSVPWTTSTATDSSHIPTISGYTYKSYGSLVTIGNNSEMVFYYDKDVTYTLTCHYRDYYSRSTSVRSDYVTTKTSPYNRDQAIDIGTDIAISGYIYAGDNDTWTQIGTNYELTFYYVRTSSITIKTGSQIESLVATSYINGEMYESQMFVANDSYTFTGLWVGNSARNYVYLSSVNTKQGYTKPYYTTDKKYYVADDPKINMLSASSRTVTIQAERSGSYTWRYFLNGAPSSKVTKPDDETNLEESTIYKALPDLPGYYLERTTGNENYTVYLNYNYDSKTGSATGNITTVEKTYYIFGNWYKDGTSGSTYGSHPVDASHDWYAKWTQGSTSTTTTDSGVTLPDATRSDYTFLGWYYGSTKINSGATGQAGRTLVAQWVKDPGPGPTPGSKIPTFSWAKTPETGVKVSECITAAKWKEMQDDLDLINAAEGNFPITWIRAVTGAPITADIVLQMRNAINACYGTSGSYGYSVIPTSAIYQGGTMYATLFEGIYLDVFYQRYSSLKTALNLAIDYYNTHYV